MSIQPKVLNQHNKGYGYKQSQHYWEHCLSTVSEISGYCDDGNYDQAIDRGASFIKSQINSLSDLPKMTEADLAVFYFLGKAYSGRGRIDQAVGCFHVAYSQMGFVKSMLTEFSSFPQRAGDELQKLASESSEDSINSAPVEQFMNNEFKKSSCFVATAVYGSSLAPEVMVFRQFRDERLVISKGGRALVQLYYFASPPVARLISRFEILKSVTRHFLLEPILRMLKSNPKSTA